MIFKEKLKRIRKEDGMSQSKFAEILDVDVEVVKSWEDGSSKPEISMLKIISNVFDVSINDLLDLDDNEREDNLKCIRYERTVFILNSLGTIFGLLLTPIFLILMKDVIPLYYNNLGVPMNYGTKYWTLFFAGIIIIFYIFSLYTHFRGMRNSAGALKALVIIQATLFIVGHTVIGLNMWFAIANAKDITRDLLPLITGSFMAFMIVLSVLSGPFFNEKKNRVFGFRTRLTLSNQEIWTKVNRFQSVSGFIFSSLAYIIILFTFKPWNVYLIILIVISVIPTVIYQEVLRNKLKKDSII